MIGRRNRVHESRFSAIVSIALLATLLMGVTLAGTIVIGKPGGKPPVEPANPAIAYIYRSGLCVMDADGSHATEIYDGDTAITNVNWAPDGSAIVFTSGYGAAIQRIDVDVVEGEPVGSNVMTLVSGSSCNGDFCGAPSWSPAGDEIAVVDGGNQGARLFMVPSTGGSQTTIYTAPSGHYLKFPTWDSDASRIAVTDVDAPGQSLSLKIIDRSTGEVLSTHLDGQFSTINHLDWARGEEIIAFTGNTESGSEAVFILDLDTGEATQLVKPGGEPTWSPDNSEIAYQGVSHGRAVINKVDVDTGTITTLKSRARGPDWKR